MIVPVIKVRDKACGHTRVVGTNHHDRLLIEDGAIHYLNIQCMCGTRYDDAAYEFIGDENYDGEIEVEMMDLDEYIDMMKRLEKEAEENERKLKEILAKKWSCNPEEIRIMS